MLELDVPTAATISDVVQQLRGRDPGGHLLPEQPLVAVNLEHTRVNQSLNEGDEVALLPPLAGG